MTRRALRFAVVTAFPEEDWHSERVLAALSGHGEAVAVDPGDLSVTLDGAEVRVRAGDLDAQAFDAFALLRGISPRGDPDAQFSVYRIVEQLGIPVVNRLEALLEAQDKLRTSFLLGRAGVLTPRAGLAQTSAQAVAIVRSLGEVVLKPLAGSLGEGVEKLPPGKAGEERAAQRVAEDRACYLQEYVPNPGRDVRVFVVGARAVGAVERWAAPGEFRTNIARGGRPVPVVLTREVEEMAVRAARALGLDYTGVDIIEGPDGPRVIEVNGNPAFDMIYEATGRDMAEELAAYLVRRACESRPWRAASNLEAGL